MNDYDIILLKSLGFKFRNKKRFVRHNDDMFIAINVYDDGYLLEIDGKLIKSKKLKIKDVLKVSQILLSK